MTSRSRAVVVPIVEADDLLRKQGFAKRRQESGIRHGARPDLTGEGFAARLAFGVDAEPPPIALAQARTNFLVEVTQMRGLGRRARAPPCGGKLRAPSNRMGGHCLCPSCSAQRLALRHERPRWPGRRGHRGRLRHLDPWLGRSAGAVSPPAAEAARAGSPLAEATPKKMRGFPRPIHLALARRVSRNHRPLRLRGHRRDSRNAADLLRPILSNLNRRTSFVALSSRAATADGSQRKDLRHGDRQCGSTRCGDLRL